MESCQARPPNAQQLSHISPRTPMHHPCVSPPLPPPNPFPRTQFISDWSEYDRKHASDDPKLLALWARSADKSVYRYHDALPPSDTTVL